MREDGPPPKPRAKAGTKGSPTKQKAPARASRPTSPGDLDLADKGLREARVIGPGFHERVYKLVRLVPRGWLTTYGDIGTMLGSARIARQVGWALAGLPTELADVPWHRVINAHGTVSYKGDLERAQRQEALLRAEGHKIDTNGRLDLEARRYRYPGVAVPFRG
ncbi:MAG TPA: MGMT family protein [Myxococcota bacterium]|nr:MGMT family protein [Myxococcota bacterium]